MLRIRSQAQAIFINFYVLQLQRGFKALNVKPKTY